MAAEALLFDLDGTICDSRPWYADLVAACGGDRARAVQQLAEGRTIRVVADDLAISRARLVAAGRDRIRELRLYPEAEATLTKLAPRGTPMALVTSLLGGLADVILDGYDLRRHFRVVVTPWWRMPAKPNPASLLRALELLGLDANPSICYVGDLASDCAAAAAAGLSFAWASWGYGGTAPAAATVVLRSFGGVLTI